MDRHSCRRSCNFSGKTTQARAASRNALLFCCSAQGSAPCQWMEWSHSSCGSGRCHFREEPAWHFSQRCTLACVQDLLTVVEEEKCIKDLLMFPSLTFLECAAGPVLGSSPLPPFQQHFLALCPCWILHFGVDSCMIKSSCTLVGSQRQPEKPLGYAGVVFLMFFVRQKRREGPAPCPWCVPSHSPRASLTVSHCSCEKWLRVCYLSGTYRPWLLLFT